MLSCNPFLLPFFLFGGSRVGMGGVSNFPPRSELGLQAVGLSVWEA